jgi:hypothetical protein
MTTHPKVFATLDEWMALSGMKRSTSYLALSRGDLRAKKVDRVLLIDLQEGLNWLRSRPDAEIRIKGAPC